MSSQPTKVPTISNSASKRKATSYTGTTSGVDDTSNIVQTMNSLNVVLGDLPKLIGDHIGAPLTDVLSSLSAKLDRIICLLESNNGYAQNIGNTTYSQAVQKNISSINHENNSSLMDKLRDLKNARGDSIWKREYNKRHAAIYSNGLQQQPQQIPKKLHEPINYNEPDELKTIKVRRSLRKVEDEIEKLQYHQKIHEEKIRRIDLRAHDLMNEILDNANKNKVQDNWNTISLGKAHKK